MPQRWVVISNCQTFGLARSIEMSARDIQCDAVDIWTAARMVAEDPERFRRYDFAVLIPEVGQWPQFAGAALPPSLELPSFEFSGYFPDSLYVTADGRPLNDGPMGAYHSLIALAAYKEGFSPDQARALYSAKSYRPLAYANRWEQQRRHVVTVFQGYGFDVRPLFATWIQRRPFMYAIDHPCIEVLHFLAQLVLKRVDAALFTIPMVPDENLGSARWPVYPELAEQLAVDGSYLFKPSSRTKPMELDAFVAGSLECFGRFDKAVLRTRLSDQPLLQRCRQVLRGDA